MKEKIPKYLALKTCLKVFFYYIILNDTETAWNGKLSCKQEQDSAWC